MEYKYVFPAEGPILTPIREYGGLGGGGYGIRRFVFST